MNFVSLPTGKLYKKKTENKKLKNSPRVIWASFKEIYQTMLIVFWGLIFMEGFPTMLIYLQKMYRSIYWELAIFLKVCKMISAIT